MTDDKQQRWTEPVVLKVIEVTSTTVSTTVFSLALYFGFRHGMRDLGRHLESGMKNMMSGRGLGAEHLEAGLDKLGKWLSTKQ